MADRTLVERKDVNDYSPCEILRLWLCACTNRKYHRMCDVCARKLMEAQIIVDLCLSSDFSVGLFCGIRTVAMIYECVYSRSASLQINFVFIYRC